VNNANSIKNLTAVKAYQNIKQGSCDSLAQYSECVGETYHGYKATETTANPENIEENERATDYFHGAFDPTDTLNEIKCTASNWVKPSDQAERRTAASFIMMEECIKLNKK
jgi:hypothetical protein